MKNKTARPRAHRKVTIKSHALIKPKPLSKKTKAETETISRWEDDGGPTIVDIGKSADPSQIDKNKESTDKC